MNWKIVFDGKVDFIDVKKKVRMDDGKNIIFEDGTKHSKKNKLNDLTSNEWLVFQKSWAVLNPQSRGKDVLLHPAKFPEELVIDYVKFFTKKGDTVLDPMVGTGSTIIGSVLSGRNAVGIELQDKYTEIAFKRVKNMAMQTSLVDVDEVSVKIIRGDARDILDMGIDNVDYVFTSPPYWDMLRMKGDYNQEKRRDNDLDLFYSDDENDVGNIENYENFINIICSIYEKIGSVMKKNAYLTIVVKNLKKGGTIYPLAWDIARLLSSGETFVLKDEKIWCQDNIKITPFGYPSAWVSNVMHHYCLNLQKS